MFDNSISVIIPVYNEALCITNSIKKIFHFFRRNFIDFEIIIIESGSTDATPEIVDKLCDGVNIRCIHEKNKNGFGSGLRLGYASAKKDLVCLYTVDFPYDLEYICKGIERIEGNDCVLSYRSADPRSVFRRIQSYIYNKLIIYILDLHARQVNSALKIFKRSVIQSLPLTENGWLIDAEVIYSLEHLGYSYKEIPVPLTEINNRKSSVSVFSFVGVVRDLYLFKRRIIKKGT